GSRLAVSRRTTRSRQNSLALASGSRRCPSLIAHAPPRRGKRSRPGTDSLPSGLCCVSVVNNAIASRMIISVIVACRNEIAEIRCFLDSVLAQHVTGRHCHVIEDDGM